MESNCTGVAFTFGGIGIYPMSLLLPHVIGFPKEILLEKLKSEFN